MSDVGVPATMKAVVHHEFGGPEVLQITDLPVPGPGPDDALVRVLAVAVDYIQLHIRRGGSGRIGSADTGSYSVHGPPYFPGGTACVEVVAVGSGVRGVEIGSRHLVGGLRPGSYVEYGLADAGQLAERPDGRPGPTAYPASMTPAEAAAFDYAPVAFHTLRIAAGIRNGETVLIHAAAGGTGSLAVQLAKTFGVTVIATASSQAKLNLVSELGADVAINYATEDFVEAVLAATGGRGVDVVWESVGGDVFTRSFDCMADGARMVSFGSNSFTGTGEVSFWPFWVRNLKLIGWGGASNAEAHSPEIMDELARLAEAGSIRPVLGEVLPLSEASRAHRMIEERNTVGKIVLTP